MRSLHTVVAASCLSLLEFGCAYEYAGRAPVAANARVYAPPAQREEQSETAWLREEVRSLRETITERDRREAALWKAYVELTQRVVQVQLARQNAKPVEPEAVAAVPECHTPAVPVAAVEPAPRKAIVHAINNSQLKGQQKRELLGSMRPPRVIDEVNPWDSAN